MRARRYAALVAGVIGFSVVVLPGPVNAAISDPIDPAANMAVASWGTDRLDLFAKGIDGTLKHKIYNGRWSAWESLGGAITSGPAAVSWGPGRIDVIARGTAGDVQHKTFSNGTWSAWASRGGVIQNQPAISSWGANRLDLFVRGTNNAVYHRAFSNGTWSSAWASLGGVVNSEPAAVSWGANRIDVFVRGGGNALYHKTWAGSWSGWTNRGGALTSGPSVLSGSSGFLDVYARVANNAISHKSFGFNQWSNWQNLGGTFKTAPAVTDWGSSHSDVFARATDDTLKQRTWHGIFGWEASWKTIPDASPTVPVAAYSPTSAVQLSPVAPALVGPLAYAYVDNIGRIVSGHQSDPANAGSVQWTVISGNEAFSGPPGLVEQPDGRLQISAQHTSGDVWARPQTARGAVTWANWVNQGGQVATAVTVARQTDGSVVLFAADSAGGLWYLTQSNVGSQYGIWRSLGVTGLAGLPTAVAGRDGLQLFARDTAGAVRTATLFPSGTLSAWTSLGGAGFTDSPAALVYPGFRMRVLARAADGTLVTKLQDSSLAWPATWTPVGTQAGAGTPAMTLSPLSGRTEILQRGADGQVYSTGETVQGSGIWRDWVPVLFFPDATATDPTILTYNDGTGLKWAFLFRTADQQSRLYTVDTGGGLVASVDGGPTNDRPSFRASSLPAAPR